MIGQISARTSFEPASNQLRTSSEQLAWWNLAFNLKPNSITLAGSKLVADHGFEPDSVMEYGFEPVCDQLRTSFEPASVMEFGFYINVTEGFIICLQGRRNAMNWGAIIWIFIRQWIVHSTLVLPQAAVPEKYAEPMCLQG